jgi:hypothetical protein
MGPGDHHQREESQMAEKLSFNRTDTTAGNLRMEGTYENIRNRASKDLFIDILTECFADSMPDVDDVMIAHHLTVVRQDVGVDAATGRTTHVEVVEEYPSADTLIFDHEVAKKIWGSAWREALYALALAPVEQRDQLLSTMFYSRSMDVATRTMRINQWRVA